MAAVIPEAAEAVTEGSAAVESAGAGGAAKSAGGLRTPAAGPKAPKLPAAGGGQKGRGERFRQQGRQQGRKTGKQLGKAKAPGDRRYQPVILAEFLLAVLVITISPVARGGSPEAQAKGSPSPYSVGDVKQLTAVGFVYFLLALLSGSKRYGRATAWFGGLVLLAVGLNQFIVGGITAIFSLWGPPQALTTPELGTPETAPPGIAATPNPASSFPVLLPGGAIVPGAQITQNYVSPPPGGTGVTTTTGSDQGTNLA